MPEYFDFNEAYSNLREELNDFINWDEIKEQIDFKNDCLLSDSEKFNLKYFLEFSPRNLAIDVGECDIDSSKKTFDIVFGDEQSHESGGGEYVHFSFKVGFDGIIISIDHDEGDY